MWSIDPLDNVCIWNVAAQPPRLLQTICIATSALVLHQKQDDTAGGGHCLTALEMNPQVVAIGNFTGLTVSLISVEHYHPCCPIPRPAANVVSASAAINADNTHDDAEEETRQFTCQCFDHLVPSLCIVLMVSVSVIGSFCLDLVLLGA